MDSDQAFVNAYTAALQGAVTHYGVIAEEESYQQLQKFCERTAQDAVLAFLRYTRDRET